MSAAACRCAAGSQAISAVAMAAAAATGMPRRTTRRAILATRLPGRAKDGVSTVPLIRKNT